MQFNELGISSQLLQAIQDLGFTEPTPIQKQSIPVLLKLESDYIGLAQTGTGKTAAFGLPLIQLIDMSQKQVQAIVLCPTRELCLQITKELKTYAQYVDKLNIVPVYGGVAFSEQARALRYGAHIVIGTPGRVLDHIKRGTLSLEKVRITVLDEADEMLNMGFQEDINAILQTTPQTKRTWLFSATMSSEVESIAKRYMKEPHKVTVGTRNSTAHNITHNYALAGQSNLYHALRRFIDYYPNMLGILFCRTRQDARELTERLNRDGYDADALHGDLSQSQRDTVMDRFRAKKVKLLIATDVAARGIDVDGVTHVFHYHIPEDTETYTHRSGRTGRAGKSGMSIALITSRDLRRIRMVERIIGKTVQQIQIPTHEAIVEQQMNYCIQAIQKPAGDDQLYAPYMETIMQACATMSKEAIMQQLVAHYMQNIIKKQNDQSDLNARVTSRSYDDAPSYSRESSSNNPRLFINIGSIDGLDKGSFLHMLIERCNVNKQDIGSISLKSNFTFFDVTSMDTAQQLITALHGQLHNNRKMRIELSGDKPTQSRRPHSGGGRSRSEYGSGSSYGDSRPYFKRGGRR